MQKPERRTLEEMVAMIDAPNGPICAKILDENRTLFNLARGSTYNHQTWPGGYWDHVEEAMNIGIVLFGTLDGIRPLPFSLSDALLILFLHDIEKPWRFELEPDGTFRNRPNMETKEERAAFRTRKLAEEGIVLTPAQLNVLTYVEGEHKDYSSLRRVSNELANFCHLADVTSARIWHDCPAAADDPWTGARRRST